MKHFTLKRTLLAACFISTIGIGQVQKHIWYLHEQEIDFTTVIPTKTVIDPQYGAGHSDYTGNGIHDADGEKVLSVAGGVISSKYAELGVLANYEAVDADRVNIIPKPGSTCSYYIVYTTYAPFAVTGMFCVLEAYYNTYYTEVDMSANGGLGQIISNGNMISQCTYYNSSSCAFAVGKELTNGNRYLYFFGANTFLPGTATPRIEKYLVSPSGITFVNTILSGSFLNTTTAVETELSHDGTMLALADNQGNQAYILHLNPVTGNLVPTAGNNGNGTSDFTIPTTTNNLTGIEFSANGNNLFVGSRTDGIFQVDVLNDIVGALPLANSSLYGNSQLELAYEPTGDYKIYAVSQTGTEMGRIVNPNTLFPTFQNGFLTGISVYSGGYQSFLSDIHDLKVLPSQIDGEDYIARFANATGECCVSLEGFSTFNFSASVSATWQPALNPFGNIPVVTIGEELRIPTGKTIHMQNMTFKFNEGAKLVIEKGAKLILTNTTLTSMDCDGLMWDGVELQGNATVDQTPFSQQGHLVMQSNSEISNAINGINVFGLDAFGNVDWSKTGGLVQATNSHFINNIRDVQYLSYNFQNFGSFRNCEFITDAAIKNGSFPYAHVTMYHVNGVGFYGNDFKNTTSGLYTAIHRGKGIKSIDAKYKVSYTCDVLLPFGVPCPDVNKDGNLFENLYFGIEATASNPMWTIDVRYNDFINNYRGAYLGGISYAYFVNNHLEVAAPFGYSYGLYMDHCTFYHVENNDFSTIYPAQTYGAIITNSNNNGLTGDVNEIYHNSFDGFDYGATAAFHNVKLVSGNPVTNTGLTFKCNTFNNSSTSDIMILQGGVSPFQGACTVAPVGSPHSQANNQFSPTPSNIGDFWNANTVVYQMNYRYEDGGTTYQTEPRPTYYNLINTTISDCGVFDPLASCPARRFDLTTGALIHKVSSAKTIGDGLIAQIDGGDTEALIDQINSGGSPGQLKNLLMSYSPYLSDEALLAVIHRTPHLPNGILKQIIIANSPVSPAVMVQIEGLSLPNGIITEIRNAQTGVSAMTELHSEISYWFRESDLNFNELVRVYLHDTIIVDGEDSVKLLLQNEDRNFTSKYNLAALYIKTGDFAAAQIIIDDLRLRDGGIHSDYCDYLELLIELEQSAEMAYAIENDADLRNTVQSFASSDEGSKAWFGATALTRFIFEAPYEEYIPVYVRPKSMMISEDNVEGDTEEQLKIYPNPANDYITIEIVLGDDEQAMMLVYDLTGKLVLTDYLTASQTTFATSSLMNGTYLINFILPDGSVIIKKLTISK